MSKVLKMTFNLLSKGTFVVAVDGVKADVTETEVRTVMESIKAGGVFKPKAGEIDSIASAEIVEQTTTPVIV